MKYGIIRLLTFEIPFSIISAMLLIEKDYITFILCAGMCALGYLVEFLSLKGWTTENILYVFYGLFIAIISADIILGIVVCRITSFRVIALIAIWIMSAGCGIVDVKKYHLGTEFNRVLKFLRSDFKNSVPDRSSELFVAHKLLGYIPSEVNMSCEVKDEKKVLTDIDDYCRTNEIPYALIKGRALNDYLYDGVKHTYGDIDLLIRSTDAEKLHSFLLGMGYFQYSGLSSIPMTGNAADKARLINSVLRSRKRFGDGSHPLKSHADMPEYAPYCCDKKISVELHDGIHFLPNGIAEKMLERTVRKGQDVQYSTLDMADTFIVLLLTAYENSESLNSNLYDHGMVLRDYVDIKNFFDKYDDKALWDRIWERVKNYGLVKMTAIIMGNLELVYDRDVRKWHLSELKSQRSLLDRDILKRMADAKTAEQSARRLFLQMIADEAKSDEYRVLPYEAPVEELIDDGTGAAQCVVRANENGKYILIKIKKAFWRGREQYMYQCRFYPTEDPGFVMYKLDLAWYGENVKSYGHKSKTIRRDAIKRMTAEEFRIDISEQENFVEVGINVDAGVLSKWDIQGGADEMYFSFNVYAHQDGDIYFQQGKRKLYRLI